MPLTPQWPQEQSQSPLCPLFNFGFPTRFAILLFWPIGVIEEVDLSFMADCLYLSTFKLI